MKQLVVMWWVLLAAILTAASQNGVGAREHKQEVLQPQQEQQQHGKLQEVHPGVAEYLGKKKEESDGQNPPEQAPEQHTGQHLETAPPPQPRQEEQHERMDGHGILGKTAGAPSKALIVTAVSGEPCLTYSGNYFNVITLKNKRDYAAMHNLQLYWTTEQLDDDFYGPWNKIALLRKLAYEYSAEQFEWFWWLDYDTLQVDMDLEVPWERYDGKHLVMWSNETKVMDEKDALGLNTGVLLLRNSDWTRSFLDLLCKYGAGWGRFGRSHWAKVMEKELNNYYYSLFDQAGFAYALITHPELREAVAWEELSLEGSYGFHVHFEHNLLLNQLDTTPLPLTCHYAGCQFCSYGVKVPKQHYECAIHFLTVYGLAANASMRALGHGFKDFNVTSVYAKLAQHDEHLPDPAKMAAKDKHGAVDKRSRATELRRRRSLATKLKLQQQRLSLAISDVGVGDSPAMAAAVGVPITAEVLRETERRGLLDWLAEPQAFEAYQSGAAGRGVGGRGGLMRQKQ